MASTNQIKSTQTSTQKANQTSGNDSIKSIADALAALPKDTEQTMKGFLDQQMANAKNVNDKLVEQFGSAIDNSEIAESLNEVKEHFRKSNEERKQDEEAAKQQEFMSNIQNDLERIMEIQGDSLRAELKRDEAINDANLNEVENKEDEKVDEETNVVKEDIKPTEVKVDVQLPQLEEKETVENTPIEPSKEETLLGDIAKAQTEQNSLLNDIGQKLTEVDETEPKEVKPNEPSKEENLLNDIVTAQTEQNALLSDIGKKLPDVDSNEPVIDNDEVNKKLPEVDEKETEPPDEPKDDSSKETEKRVSEVNDSLGKINDSLDDILDQFGDSVANTDINEPVPVNVHVDVENKLPEPEKPPVDIVENKLPEPEKPAEEISDEPKSVELAEGSMNSLRELADTIKQNEDELLEKLGNQAVESNAENARLNKESITELANDISGASDAMNNQDDTPLKPREDEKAEPEDNSRNERPVTEKSLQFDEETNQATATEEPAPVLDTRMDMAERAERDITPKLNEVQMFNRMSLTKEEIMVLASEIGKAVRENLVDRDGDRARDAAYLDEVERMMKG
jgi:hypothetical protein